jgi:O-antigen ligase
LAAILSTADRQFIRRAIVIGSIVGSIILLIESLTPLLLTTFFYENFKGHGVEINYTYMNFFRNGANIAALIVFPASAVLWRYGNKSFAVSFIAFTLVTLFYSKAGGAVLALLIGLMVIAATYAFGRYARVLFSSVVIVSILFFPAAVSMLPSAGEVVERYPNLPNSVYPRIFIWQSTAKYIFETPFLGKGFNSSRAISRSKDPIKYSTKGKTNRESVPIPLHPHSAIMQIWIELGIVGIGLFLTLIVNLLQRIEQSTTSLSMRAMAYGSFFSAFTVANISYGIWQNWWVCALWLITSFTIIAVRDDPSKKGDTKDYGLDL